jgi:RimJ/RimL family protein N-acetyltransferase
VTIKSDTTDNACNRDDQSRRSVRLGMAALRFPDPPLHDDVVLLRPWTESDISRRAKAFTDPLLQRFSVPTTDPVTEISVRARFAGEEGARERGEEISFALTSPQDPSELYGGASLYELNWDEQRAAVGFYLVPQARGRGIATHATLLIAKWAFDALKIARLELTCAPDNEASQRVAERCGFTREGVLRSYLLFKGQRRDTVMFSLLPSDMIAPQ